MKKILAFGFFLTLSYGVIASDSLAEEFNTENFAYLFSEVTYALVDMEITDQEQASKAIDNYELIISEDPELAKSTGITVSRYVDFKKDTLINPKALGAIVKNIAKWNPK